MNKLRRIRHLEACFLHSLCNKVPVDVIPVLVEVLCLSVFVVDVPCVLPCVDCEEWEAAVLDWVEGVRVLADFDLSVLALVEVAPAGSEDCHCLLCECLLELVEGLEVLSEDLFDFAWDSDFVGCEAVPEEGVVVVLCDVVEEWACGLLDDLLDWLALEFCALDEIVACVDVGLVVLCDVDLDGVWCEEAWETALEEWNWCE